MVHLRVLGFAQPREAVILVLPRWERAASAVVGVLGAFGIVAWWSYLSVLVVPGAILKACAAAISLPLFGAAFPEALRRQFDKDSKLPLFGAFHLLPRAALTWLALATLVAVPRWQFTRILNATAATVPLGEGGVRVEVPSGFPQGLLALSQAPRSPEFFKALDTKFCFRPGDMKFPYGATARGWGAAPSMPGREACFGASRSRARLRPTRCTRNLPTPPSVVGGLPRTQWTRPGSSTLGRASCARASSVQRSRRRRRASWSPARSLRSTG